MTHAARAAAHLCALILSLVGCLAACSSGSFSGTSGNVSDRSATLAAPIATPTPSPTPAPGACAAGDKIDIAWTGPAKACIVDQKGTYNFDLNQCVQMPQASFACDWKTVSDQLAALGLESKAIDAAAQDGSKLVTCSASADGQRIVVQWVKAPPASASLCSYDPATTAVITGCYMVEPDGVDPPAPASQAEQDKIVYACMSGL